MYFVLWHNRELLWTLVKRDLKVRYKASVLGFFWSFCKPLLLTLVLLAVFSNVPRFELQAPRLPFVLHLLAGVLAWSFFSGSVHEGMFSILSNADLVKKVKLPVETLPAASVCSNLIHFLLAQCVLLFFCIVFGVPPTGWIVLAPIPILLLTALALSVASLTAALNVFYRDVVSIMEIVMQAWFYGTPIFYALYHARGVLLDRLGPWAYWLFVSNPLTPIVLAYRRCILAGALEPRETPDGHLLVLLALACVVIFIVHLISVAVFRRLRPRFADEL
ncbi:MAG: ABC transporter permease [Candidatus Sumerlaeia bacterium]